MPLLPIHMTIMLLIIKRFLERMNLIMMVFRTIHFPILALKLVSRLRLMCSRSYYLGFILFCCLKWKNFHKHCNSLLLFLLKDDELFLFHFGKNFSTFHSFPVLVIYCDAYWCIFSAFVWMFIFIPFLQLLIMPIQFILLL